MIKRPDEINEIVRKFDKAGWDVICAGQCITGSVMGEEALDWDLYTECPQDKIREMFPDGEVIGKRTTRLDYTRSSLRYTISHARRRASTQTDRQSTLTAGAKT